MSCPSWASSSPVLRRLAPLGRHAERTPLKPARQAGFGRSRILRLDPRLRRGTSLKAPAVAVATAQRYSSVDDGSSCAGVGRGSRVPEHGVVRPAAEAGVRRATAGARRLAGRSDQLGAVGGAGGRLPRAVRAPRDAAAEDVALGSTVSQLVSHLSTALPGKARCPRAGHRVHVDRVPVAGPGRARDRRPVRPTPRPRRRDRRAHGRRRVQRRAVVDGRGGADGRDRPRGPAPRRARRRRRHAGGRLAAGRRR